MARLLAQQPTVERLADPRVTGPYYVFLAQAHSVLGNRAEAADAATRAVHEARACGDDATEGKAYTVLAREAYWLGLPLDGVEHGRRAATLLAGANERHWLGIAYWLIGRHHFVMGQFEPALEALARARAVGEAIDDLRLQNHVAWTTGEILVLRGETDPGTRLCERAVELAPDPLNVANALGHLGAAYVEQGDAARAIPLLERCVTQFGEFRGGQAHGWFTTVLGEAYTLDGDLARAGDVTVRGLELLEQTGYRRGVAWARRVLVRIALRRGALAEAESHLTGALDGFVAGHGDFEVARTHLALAKVGHRRGQSQVAAAHLEQAHAIFARLDIAHYLHRTTSLAAAFGVAGVPAPAANRLQAG